MMEPFVAVMRRYIEDYVNPHDVSVCEEIMTPDYVVHIGGRHLAGGTTATSLPRRPTS